MCEDSQLRQASYVLPIEEAGEVGDTWSGTGQVGGFGGSSRRLRGSGESSPQ